jgi:hypothetical protein
MWASIFKFLKAVCNRLAPWVRYAYFLRFSILLWLLPLLLVLANSPSIARSLVSGIVTPISWIQYLCSVFFMISGSFVALILARIVVINGQERFGDVPPALLTWIFAGSDGRYEWVAPVLSQLNNLCVFLYFFFNGSKEHVAGPQIAIGIAAGIVLAAAFWYSVTAFYYLIYEPSAERANTPGFGAAAARTLLLPRSWMFLSEDGQGHKKGDVLEDAITQAIPDWISRLFPVPGYRWSQSGQLYEGHIFSILAACGFFALYWMLWPLTAPVPVPLWSWVSVVFYLLFSLTVVVVVFSARAARESDARKLLAWKILLAIAALGFAVAIPCLYFFSDAERFPILALVFILLIALSWAMGAIAFFADRFRIPVITTLVLVTVIPRMFNWTDGKEEHYLSIALRQTQVELPTPAQILEQRLKEDPNQPLVVVTSTGGGIHAAAWTTAVLGHIEQEFAAGGSTDSFHHHVLLLSTVSGGSSGLFAYLREIDRQTDDGRPDWDRMRFAAQCSSLEAVGWGLVYYDIPKAFLPFLPYFVPPSSGINDLDRSPMDKDRTWALRRAFARNLNDPYCRLDPRSKVLIPLSQVAEAGREDLNNVHTLTVGSLDPMQDAIPAITMNTTTVEGGDRYLLANYQVPNPKAGPLVPPPAESFLEMYGGVQFPGDGANLYADLPLATGAQLSATFPYVSSAATFPAAGGAKHFHFVDGGYYDNDGTGSAIEFLQSALDGLPQGSPPVHIVLVEIRNSGTGESSPGTEPWNLADQLVAPLEAFYGAGHESVTDRNRNALILLEGAYKGRLDLVDHIVIADTCAYYSVHTDPLNWSLTPAQQQEVVSTAKLPMNKEKYEKVKSYFGPAAPTGMAQAPPPQDTANPCTLAE